MKILSYALVALILSSCGATVATDYDKQTNFEQYKTYNFFPEITSGLSELDNKRIIRVTDSLLQQRGFVKTEDPQFLINFFANETVSRSGNTIGIGIGGGGGNLGVGVGGGIPIGGRSINQRLTLDFIDTTKDDLFWQAISDGDFKEKMKPVKKEQYYANVINKMLNKFPPKK